MRKGIKIALWTILLAGGIITCVVRWQVWFGMPAEPEWTGDTLSYTFRSVCDSQSAIDYQQSSMTILVLGDIHNQLKQADYDTLAARVPHVDVVAQAGDWMDRGQEYYRQLLLREWSGSQLRDKPVIVCPGNHEYSKGLCKKLSPVWIETFGDSQIGNSQSPVGNRLTAVPGATYYTDLPFVRFIVIDTNPLDRLVYLTRTVTWLRQAMNTAEGRYTVVMMHHPVLPAGKGRFCPLIYATFRYALGAADLVICGHDHSYLRRAPFIVLNTAGKPKTQQTCYSAECTSADPVYGVITIDQSPMTFTVYRMSDGLAIDYLHVTHD